VDNDGLEIADWFRKCQLLQSHNLAAVKFLALVEGFTLVPCGKARFCENYARRAADVGALSMSVAYNGCYEQLYQYLFSHMT